MKGKIKSKFTGRDWNTLMHELCAILIGIGMGLYAYESNVALYPVAKGVESDVESQIKGRSQTPGRRSELPLTRTLSADGWDSFKNFFKGKKGGGIQNPLEELEKKIEKDFNNLKPVQRVVQYPNEFQRAWNKTGFKGRSLTKLEEASKGEYQAVPQKWTTKENRPFFIIGLVLIIAATLIKLFMYIGIIDFNALKAGYKKKKRRVDWNGIVQEISTFGLSMLIGIYSDSFMYNISHTDKTAYPYGILGFVLMGVCLIIKGIFYFDLIDINPKPKKQNNYKPQRKVKRL